MPIQSIKTQLVKDMYANILLCVVACVFIFSYSIPQFSIDMTDLSKGEKW